MYSAVLVSDTVLKLFILYDFQLNSLIFYYLQNLVCCLCKLVTKTSRKKDLIIRKFLKGMKYAERVEKFT